MKFGYSGHCGSWKEVVVDGQGQNLRLPKKLLKIAYFNMYVEI